VGNSVSRWDKSAFGLMDPAAPDSGGRLTFTLLYEVGIEGNPHRWRFILRSPDGHDELIAEDVEPGVQGERLELLTVLRALESLNQSSRIIIWTRSPALKEGLLYGLRDWPLHDWCWERFGERVPVRNRDLWQRLERVIQFHEIECRAWRFDPPHVHEVSPPNSRGFGQRAFAPGKPKSGCQNGQGDSPGGSSWKWLFGAFLPRRSAVSNLPK